MELPNFRRGRHLYSTGRPSRWALAHILVILQLGTYAERTNGQRGMRNEVFVYSELVNRRVGEIVAPQVEQSVGSVSMCSDNNF